MLHFLQNLQYYITFEVLEPNWHLLEQNLKKVENLFIFFPQWKHIFLKRICPPHDHITRNIFEFVYISPPTGNIFEFVHISPPTGNIFSNKFTFNFPPHYQKHFFLILQATTIDEVLQFHGDFLDTCLTSCMLTDRNLVKLLHSIMALCGMYAEKTSSIINSLHLDIDDTLSEKLVQEVKEDKKKAELLRKTKIKVTRLCVTCNNYIRLHQNRLELCCRIRAIRMP
jgi:hypothetical protein